MTVVADRASFHIIKFDCPLFSSEMCGRDGIKVYNFSCMCSVSTGTDWRIYYFEEREAGAKKYGPRLFYFPSNNLMGLNYITDFNSSHLLSDSLSSVLLFSLLPSVLCQSPGGQMLSSLLSQRALEPDNTAACCLPTGLRCNRRKK